MNQRLSVSEFNNMVNNFYAFGNVDFGVHAWRYRGNPLVQSKYYLDFVIFEECEWCKNGNSLDENDCCIHCGGPVE